MNGGQIYFSTAINAIQLHGNPIVNKLKQRIRGFANSIQIMDIITEIAITNGCGGFSLMKGIRGRYMAEDGTMYDERSMCLTIAFVDSETLNKVASQLAAALSQESVMLVDMNEGINTSFPTAE